MTVVRVWGGVDGTDVICTRIEGTDVWQTLVPPDFSDGMYICEFFAEDIAGNISMRTATLWITAGGITCIEWQSDLYRVKLLRDVYTAEFISAYEVRITMNQYKTVLITELCAEVEE